MSANFSLYCFGSIHDSDMPPVICKYISSGKYTSCVILYSTCKFWGENCTDPGCGDTRSSHPLPPGKSPRHVWSVENHHELAAFPWVGGNSTQENQGAINKLDLSTQFYFPFSRQSWGWWWFRSSLLPARHQPRQTRLTGSRLSVPVGVPGSSPPTGGGSPWPVSPSLGKWQDLQKGLGRSAITAWLCIPWPCPAFCSLCHCLTPLCWK